MQDACEQNEIGNTLCDESCLLLFFKIVRKIKSVMQSGLVSFLGPSLVNRKPAGLDEAQLSAKVSAADDDRCIILKPFDVQATSQKDEETGLLSRPIDAALQV